MSKNTPLSHLRNIGHQTERWLNEIGIYTLAQLEAIGPVAAYRQLKELHYNVSLNLVYAIQGAILNAPWNELPPAMREQLQAEVAALSQQSAAEPPLFIVDGHLDIAYNALKFGRDFRRTVAELRQQEADAPSPNGIATIALPDLMQAGVGLALASIFVMPINSPMKFVYHEPTTYENAHDAHRKGMAQLDYYHRLADESDAIRLVTDLASLNAVVDSRQPGKTPLFGIIPAMEGADPIRKPEELAQWIERGVRSIGLAWDDTRYAAGAWRDQGGLTADGYRLMEMMAEHKVLLDITHMSEKASLEALERYPGVVVASHCNSRALVPSPRQLSDEQIRLLGERDGLIGVVLFNPFLRAGQRKGDPKAQVTLDHVTAHIDHICQVLGEAAHVGIGSDLDGGFGAADIPTGLDSAADLPNLAAALRQKGYREADVAGIMGGNWLTLLQRSLGS